MKNLRTLTGGKRVTWTNGTGSAVSAGDPLNIGTANLAAVACVDIANGSSGEVLIGGGPTVTFPVKGHDGAVNAAVTAFDKVYFTAGEAFFDVDGAATLWGIALAAVASGATTTIEVMLAQQ